MKIVFPGITHVFECGHSDFVWTLVIESPSLMYDLVTDLDGQLSGNDGRCVVSEDNVPLDTGKYLELITAFVPFDINKKSLVSRLITALSGIAEDDMHYAETVEILGKLEQYCMGLTFDLTGNIHFSKMNIEAVIKAFAPGFMSDYESLAEKLLDYFELVRAYERDKLFILVNLGSFMERSEMQLFLDAVTERDIKVLLLENCQRSPLNHEKIYIVDRDLCEIM